MQIGAWLRMQAVGGGYPASMSDVSYTANKQYMNWVFPIHGGKLQADGSWLQEAWKLTTPFALGLKADAQALGQLYVPSVSTASAAILKTVLDDPALQIIAADNLVILATSTRFDAPWDGVCLDLEGSGSAYKDKLSDFYNVLYPKLNAVGLQVHLWARGIVSDPGPDYDDAYAHDWSVLGSVADYVHIGAYGYWRPIPRGHDPYWWIAGCIQYAIGMGVPPRKILLSLALYSLYYDDPLSLNATHGITYTQARSLAAANPIIWEESNINGLVRSYRCDIALNDYIYFCDYDSTWSRLGLVTTYNLAGISLFVLGMEYPELSESLSKWILITTPIQYINWDIIQEIHFGNEPALINGLFYVPLVCLIRGEETEVIAVTSNLATLQAAVQNITPFQAVYDPSIDWTTMPEFVNNPHRHGPYIYSGLHAHANYLWDV